ncbi:hypothetical protein ACHAQA_009983 [Verticillium albo-atrum]
MVEGKEMAPFIAANGQKPGWKRGSPPSKIRVPARRIAKRADLDGDSSDDEAGPARQTRRAPATTTRDTLSTRDDDLPTPVPNLDLTNDAVLDDGSASDSDSGPDSPTSPTSPTTSPAASAPPPPAAQPPVTLTPIRPPGPQPTPEPELPPPPPPPPAAPPSPTTTPPLVLPSAAPAAPPLVRPDFSSQPIPRPNLPINDQIPDQPITAPLEPPAPEPTTVTAPPEIRTITAAPPIGTARASSSSSDLPSTFPLSITTRAPALPVFDPTPPRKELEPPNTFSPTTTSPDAAFATTSSTSSSLVTGTALPVEEIDSSNTRGRMDPNTEHALIAVGSIGSFIFASFIIWIVWRTARRTRKKRRERQSQMQGLSQGPPPPPSNPGIGMRIAAKIPFLRNRGWRNLDDGASEPPPYEKGGRGSLRLDTDMYGGVAKFQPGSATYSQPQTSANGTPVAVSPLSSMLQRNDTIRAQQGTYQSGDGTLDSIMAKYGNGGDMNSTLQSAAGGLYYTESEIARQQSNGYDRQRQASRASAMSSLSSGFGDGDIIVPGLQPPPPTSHPMRSTQNVVGRYSWVSKSGSNRETIYTETSEDMPPRFRTVNSWVNQQTGRVKRAQGRGEEESDVPPVPGLPAALGQNIMPPEQQFNMMMPDGEEPRRPDGVDYQSR